MREIVHFQSYTEVVVVVDEYAIFLKLTFRSESFLGWYLEETLVTMTMIVAICGYSLQCLVRSHSNLHRSASAFLSLVVLWISQFVKEREEFDVFKIFGV